MKIYPMERVDCQNLDQYLDGNTVRTDVNMEWKGVEKAKRKTFGGRYKKMKTECQSVMMKLSLR